MSFASEANLADEDSPLESGGLAGASWHGLVGHHAVVERFRQAIIADRLASTFLFVGPAGVGKRLFARLLAQALLCQTHTERQLDPCGHCPSCLQVAAHSHPDVIEIAKPADKSFIPIELLIGDREHRMREGLCHDISLKPSSGRRKVAIIDDADFLNTEGANALLKTLEEPPPRSLLIVIGTSLQKQLPTIRSRSQIVPFGPLPEATIAQLLVDKKLVEDPGIAARLAKLAQGSLQRALELNDPALWEFRERLLEHLAAGDPDAQAFGAEVAAFVDAAGKEAPPRRQRLRQVIGLAAGFYRAMLRREWPEGSSDADLDRAVKRAANWWSAGDLGVASAIDRCLLALQQVDANANQATLIDCWLDDLAAIARTGCI